MANLNLSQFGENTSVSDADYTFVWDSAASISKRVSRNSWLSGTTADFHLGLADAATAVAQTISVQSVVAGTTNTAGANLSINGSQGTGTGAGGSLFLRTAPAGSSGTAQNALVTAVAITSAGNVGIGTTSPSSKLHVDGSSLITGTLNVNNVSSLSNFVALTLTGKGGSSLLFDTGIIYSNSTLVLDTASANLQFNRDTILLRDEQYHLALRNGTNGQKFSVYGTYPGAAWERFTITAPTSGNVLLGTYKGTGGIARGLEIQVDGATRLTFPTSGNPIFNTAVTFGLDISGQRDVYCGAGRHFRFPNNSAFTSAGAGVVVFEDLGLTNTTPRFQLGGTTDSFPALKRSATRIQAVLATTDTTFTNIQGKLTTDTAYDATPITPTGFLTLYDSTGTAYKVACQPA